jgi:hypothetical protein
MLGRKNYTRKEFDDSKAEVDRQIAAYKKLVKAVDNATSDKKVGSALDAFAPLFFKNMVLVLDRPFVHRLRTITGKDGNALNEVELLVESLMNNNGIFRGNNVIKYVSDQSVLESNVGKPIVVTEEGFERLSAAFFGELRRKFL